ncbi:helix-turn-helix transcriptional regulator [Anaerovoracaceae bacterium 42-11]
MKKYEGTIHTRFSQICKREELTSRQVREELGLSPSHLSYIMNDKKYLATEKAITFIKNRKTNLSYLLTQTDIDLPCDTYSPHNRLTELRENAGYTRIEFCGICNMTYKTLLRYETNEILGPLSTLLLFSSILQVSVDYLLGLTEYRRWEDASSNPIIRNLSPGKAGYMELPHLTTYFLVSDDGDWVLFPDGTKEKITSPNFRDAKILEVMPREHL